MHHRKRNEAMQMIGRALRRQMKADAEERRHPKWADERKRRAETLEQARADTAAKFPTITAENAAEAIAFQEARIKELLK
jgi:hypothetical protein